MQLPATLPPKNYCVQFNSDAIKLHGISVYHACVISLVHQTADDTGWSDISNQEIKQVLGIEKTKVVSLMRDLDSRKMLSSNGFSNQKRRLTVTEYGFSAIRISVSTDETAEAANRITVSTDEKTAKIAENLPEITLVISDKNIVSKEDNTSTILDNNTYNSAKKEKKKNVNKYPDGFFAKCRGRYEEWRKTNSLPDEYFAAKEVGSLRNLLNALKFTTTPRIAGTPDGELPTDYEALYDAFSGFLDKMPTRYIESGANIAMLYSSYNTIVAMQNAEIALQDKNVEAVVAAFRTRIKSLPTDYIATETEKKAAKELMNLLQASAKQKTPGAETPSNEKLAAWAQLMFERINNLDWWGQRTSTIAFVVRNYNAITQALSTASTLLPKNSKKQPAAYGTNIDWKNPRAAEIFQQQQKS